MKTMREKAKARHITSAKDKAEQRGKGMESTSLAIPEGVSLFKLKSAGVKKIDILPYIVGDGNPYAKKGDVHYERTFYAYRGIGADSQSFVAPSKTLLPNGKFGKDPIAEYRAKLTKNPNSDEDLIKDLSLKKDRYSISSI